MLRRLFLSFIVCLLSFGIASAQDFKVDKYRENTMDMSAATSGVKDLNGVVAGLLRFVVRDDKFDFDANLGVLKKVQKTGEVWLFVPQDTRRITISHPLLGVLRGYELPEAVKSKTTYDAEIVITNETYLRTLMQQGAKQSDGGMPAPVQPADTVSTATAKPVTPTDSVTTIASADSIKTIIPDKTIAKDSVKRQKSYDDIYVLQTSASLKPKRDIHAAFGISAGYSLFGVQGPTVSIEACIKSFCIEAGGTLGMKKVTDIGIYRDENLQGAYDYSSKKLFVSIGTLLNPKSVVQLTLKGGVSLTAIDGKEQVSHSDKDFSCAHVISAFAGLRISVAFGKHLQLFATPQYNIDVSHGDTYDLIKEVDSTIKQWGTGLGLTAGLLIKF